MHAIWCAVLTHFKASPTPDTAQKDHTLIFVGIYVLFVNVDVVLAWTLLLPGRLTYTCTIISVIVSLHVLVGLARTPTPPGSSGHLTACRSMPQVPDLTSPFLFMSYALKVPPFDLSEGDCTAVWSPNGDRIGRAVRDSIRIVLFDIAGGLAPEGGIQEQHGSDANFCLILPLSLHFWALMLHRGEETHTFVRQNLLLFGLLPLAVVVEVIQDGLVHLDPSLEFVLDLQGAQTHSEMCDAQISDHFKVTRALCMLVNVSEKEPRSA